MSEYTRKLTWSKLKVGAIVTAALLIILVVVITYGSLPALFRSRAVVHASFSNVQGLKEGAPVWLSGIEVGSVASMKFIDDRIRVSMTLNENAIHHISAASTATIRSLGLLGDKYVEISPGPPGSPAIKPGGTIQGIQPPDVGKVLRTGEESLADITALIRRLNDLIAMIESKKGTVSLMLTNPQVYNNIKQSTGELDRFLKKLNASGGTVGNLVENPALYENMNRILLDLDRLIRTIETGPGLAGKLIYDRQLTADLESTILELKSLLRDIRENPKKYFKFSIF